MAYQPSGSSSSNSAGTMVQEQHEQYFKAWGVLRSARSIFFEQLIARLVVWKATDADIILLGDFNENVYTGWIAKCLEQVDLNFSKQCLGCTGMHIPPTFRDGIMSTTPCMLRPESNVSTHTFSLTKAGLETIDVLLLTSARRQLLEWGSRTLFNALQGSSIVNWCNLFRHTTASWIWYAVNIRYRKEYTSCTLMWNTSPTRTLLIW